MAETTKHSGKPRPQYVARMDRYQISITLTDREADKLEALRIQWACRSWNAVVRRLLADSGGAR